MMKKNKLPQDWQFKKVSEFTEVITGGTPSTAKKEYWENGTIPWLPSGDLKDKPLKLAHIFITKEGLKNSAARLMPKKTVLIALTGATTGQTAILEIEASANQSVTGILPSKEHIPEYLFYYLRTIRGSILNQTYGGAQPHISQGFVKDIEILLPPLPIQKKIASILEKAEKLKQKREQADKLTKEYLQSIFYEMFLGKFESVKLKNLCSLITKGTTPTTYGHSFVDSGINFFKIENLDEDGNIIADSFRYISDEAHNFLKRSQLAEGDVIFSIAGALGRVAIIKKEHLPANINQAIAIIRLRRDSKINKKYLEFYLRSSTTIKQITENKRGVAQLNLNLEQVGNLEIILPPHPLQQKFSKIVENVEKLKEKQKQSKKVIDEMFNSLMQKAFKGELVV